MNTEPTKNQIDIEYRWAVYDYQTGVRTEVQGWKLNGEWIRWYPPYNGNFEMYCTARVAGNTDSQLEAHVTVGYNGIVSTDISSDMFMHHREAVEIQEIQIIVGILTYQIREHGRFRIRGIHSTERMMEQLHVLTVREIELLTNLSVMEYTHIIFRQMEHA